MTQPNSTPARELAVWALAILCVTAVALMPLACTVSRHRAVADAIKAGADPIAAKCAIEGDNRGDPLCVGYVATRPK
jgi:hypothetical protein